MRILTSNLRRAWSPVRLPKQWMPQGAQPVSHSWIRHLYHLVNRQDHPAWRFCQRRKLQVSKTTFLPANLVDVWFVLLCSHFSVMPWWTFVRPKVPLVRLSAELLFGTPIFLEPEPQALKVNIHQSRFQRCTISIHFCLFCLVHLCPVFKFQIFNLCRESEKVTCFFSFLILESWRIPSCWRHLCFVGSTLQWFAYFILFSFSTSSIMSTRSLWPLKFSFLWCIFFKVSTEFPPLRQHDRWVCAQDSPGDSRARYWPPRWALVILHSNVTWLSSHTVQYLLSFPRNMSNRNGVCESSESKSTCGKGTIEQAWKGWRQRCKKKCCTYFYYFSNSMCLMLSFDLRSPCTPQGRCWQWLFV